jgi:sugar phosphate isomerase/epimerase
MPTTSPARAAGVQSWSLRQWKDNPGVIAQLKKLGATSLELCGAHCRFDDPADHAPVIKAYRDAGLRIDSIGVQTFTGDVAKEKVWFDFAKAAGARFISAHFQVHNFREAVKVCQGLSESYGIRVAIHCHGGYMFGGSFDVIDHLMTLGGPHVGVCIDTAWCIQSGHADPVQWVKKWGKKVYGVHYKDFVFDRAGGWKETVIGQGCLKLTDFVHALEDVGFDGYAVYEYEEADAVEGLAKDIAALAAVPARGAAKS